MAADKKFSDFTEGNEMKVGDRPVGLRPEFPTLNFIFDFPGTGILDSNGNYLFQYATAGTLAVNNLKFINSLTGLPVTITAAGDDSNIDISVQPKGSGKLILDELNWPTADGTAGQFMFTDGSGNLGFTSGVATDIIGTANQVLANGTTGTPQSGSVTLTTPQDIALTSSPTFNNLKLTGASILDANGNIIVSFASQASAVNYLEVTNAPANQRVLLTTVGATATIPLNFRPKGGVLEVSSSDATAGQLWLFASNGNDYTGLRASESSTDLVFTLPAVDGSNRSMLMTNGSGTWSFTTETYAVPGASGNVMTSNGTNWVSSPSAGTGTVSSGLINQLAWYAASGTTVSGLATLASGVLVTSAGSVPSISTTLPNVNIGTPTAGVLTSCTGLPISSGVSGLGTGVATALAVNTGSAGAIVLFNGALGTPSSGTLTSCTGLPVSTGISGLGTGVATALAVNIGSAGAFITFNGALGTPSSGTLTNCTGLPISGTTGYGTGVATALAVNVGTAGAFVVNGGALGTPSSGTLTSCTGLPVSSGISGLGTGVATALAVNTGTAGAFVVNGGALGTPSSGTLSSCTAYPGAWIGRQILKSGTTYTPTSGTKRIFGRMLGGGGGSSGTGTGAPTAGGNAGATTFDSSAYTAPGGGGCPTNGLPGVSGGAGTVVSATTDISIGGAAGGFGALLSTSAPGASTFLGGGGNAAGGGGAAVAGATNSGGGAGGPGPNGSNNGGSGAAAGSYTEFWKGSISGTYTYAIGAGGTAGAAGTGGLAGAIGGSGIIIIDEYS